MVLIGLSLRCVRSQSVCDRACQHKHELLQGAHNKQHWINGRSLKHADKCNARENEHNVR